MPITTRTEIVRSVKLYLRCPQGGSADLAITERLTASCQGNATLTIAPDGSPRPEFTPAGGVNWDSSTIVSVECRSCLWSCHGAEHLGQLTTTITAEH